MRNEYNPVYNLKRLLLSRGISLEKIDETLKILSESKNFLEKNNKGRYKIGACCL